MAGALLYNPERVRVLALESAAAIEWLDGRTSDEPMAESVVAMLRRASHTLATTWLPHLQHLIGDTSMTAWDADAPDAMPGEALGFAGAATRSPADDPADIDRLVTVAQRAATGDTEALLELSEELEEHRDDPAFLAAFAQSLGPGVDALIVGLGTTGTIRVGVSSPAVLAARDAVVDIVLRYRDGVLTDPTYTLEGNVRLASPAGLTPELNPGCVDLGDSAPGGGGYVVGPDGRTYPIVVEDELPGSGDWQVVCYQSGVERFQAPPSGLDRLWGFFAGSTGEVQAPPPNEALHFIAMAPGAPPHLTQTPRTPAPIDPIRGADAPDPADSSAAAVIPASLDLAITAGQGVSFAVGLDHQRQRAYQVVFEENSQGLRRARVETFTLAYGDDGDVVIVPQNVFVNVDGELMSNDIIYPSDMQGAAPHVSPLAYDGDREVTPQPIPGATLP